MRISALAVLLKHQAFNDTLPGLGTTLAAHLEGVDPPKNLGELAQGQLKDRERDRLAAAGTPARRPGRTRPRFARPLAPPIRQRQRAALARAMVRQPAAFLMDEPLSNLDAKLRIQVRDELADLHRRLGATFVFVTHDQTEAMSLSSRVAVMQHGRILQFATPQTLYEQPDCLDVARFVGSPSINVVPLRAEGGLRQLAGTESIALAGPGAQALMTQGGAAAIRPEHLLVAPGREAFAGPADAQVPATLRHAEHHGADWILQVQVAHWPEPVSVRVPLRQWTQPIKPGDAVRLGWRWSDWLLFDASGSRCDAQAISPRDSTMSAVLSDASAGISCETT